jgi:CBS domain containing-hemolysin-like protein
VDPLFVIFATNALVAGVVLSVLAASEAALSLLSPGRIHRLAESERPGANALLKLAENPPALGGATAVARAVTFALAGYAAVVAGTRVIASSEVAAALWALGLVAGALVAFALFDALARTVGVANPERVALDAAPVAWPLVRVLSPVAVALSALWVWGVHLVGGERISSPWVTEADDRTAAESPEEAEREEAEEAFLEAVSDFAEKVAREVMVPRPDVAALPESATSADVIALVEKRGFSRLPVYRGSIDDVAGMVYAKDLLIRLGKGCGEIPIAELTREPYFVPETMPVEELLLEFRNRRVHIAVVTDEYGGTAGIVTMEDLLEEIVGEIADEYDREAPLFVQIGEGEYDVDALLPVDDFNEIFGTALESDADSTGGLVYEVAGHVPVVGESVEVEGVRVTVTAVDGNRIRRLRVRTAQTDEGV